MPCHDGEAQKYRILNAWKHAFLDGVPGPLQELQALDLELQEATVEKQADPFLLYLHGLVHIDRQVCSLPFDDKTGPSSRLTQQHHLICLQNTDRPALPPEQRHCDQMTGG